MFRNVPGSLCAVRDPDAGRANVDLHAIREAVASVEGDEQVDNDQRLNLNKDDRYLYLAVWDTTSGRIGTLQIPVQVPKPS